jgi:hypothetical protein
MFFDVLKDINAVLQKESVLTTALKLFNANYSEGLSAIERLNISSKFAEKITIAEMFLTLEHDQRNLFINTNKNN